MSYDAPKSLYQPLPKSQAEITREAERARAAKILRTLASDTTVWSEETMPADVLELAAKLILEE